MGGETLTQRSSPDLFPRPHGDLLPTIFLRLCHETGRVPLYILFGYLAFKCQPESMNEGVCLGL